MHANNSCVVGCGGSRCKTCKHLVVGSSFASNVTGKSYNISCPRGSISCGTKNVIYVILCKKCGVQYVGKTSQTLKPTLEKIHISNEIPNRNVQRKLAT